METAEIVQELKKALRDLDDCEMNIKRDNNQRALYDLSYGYDRIKKLMRKLKSA